MDKYCLSCGNGEISPDKPCKIVDGVMIGVCEMCLTAIKNASEMENVEALHGSIKCYRLRYEHQLERAQRAEAELSRKDAEIARIIEANNESMMKAMEREMRMKIDHERAIDAIRMERDRTLERSAKATEHVKRLRSALERCRHYFSDLLTVEDVAMEIGGDWSNKTMEQMCADALEGGK